MNPFTCPERVFISTAPCDMRAGINSLRCRVEADFGADPADGSLYVFVSRDATKAKMLKRDGAGWCLYYARLSEGHVRWTFSPFGKPCLEASRADVVGMFAEASPVTSLRARPRKNIV